MRPALLLHGRHVLSATLHTGRPPPQSSSPAHWAHFPAPVPSDGQPPMRHCALAVQVPSPWARPQRLSVASHAPLVQARAPSAATHKPPGRDVPFASRGVQVPGVVNVLHQLCTAQSPSRVQAVPHDPSVRLQKPASEPQACPAALPALPSHATHVAVIPSQSGARPSQSRSVRHPTQVPARPAALAHTPARHCRSLVQRPSPVARPQRWSARSQAPLSQARAANPTVQTPPGSDSPLGILGVHVPGVVKRLHQNPPAQSLSPPQLVPHDPSVVLQNGAAPGQAAVARLPAFPLHATHVFDRASHSGVVPAHWVSLVHSTHVLPRTPVAAHTPTRQVALVPHGPSPRARPQRLSAGSQMPLLQAVTARVGVQAPGRGTPLSSLAAQVPGVVKVLHQRPPLQSVFSTQLVPQDPKDKLQNGVPTAHARLAAVPAFPLHAKHRLVARSQMGVALPQSALPAHCPHFPAPGPVCGQIPVRH